MSFGSKQLDSAYDQWATQTPEDYYGYEEEEEEEPKDDKPTITK